MIPQLILKRLGDKSMRKKHFIVAAGLATILTLGCCSCSASHESTTTVSTEFTSEDGTTDEEGTCVTTTDAANGSSFTMGIIEQDEEGNLVLDMSDDYGQATLEPCGMDTLLEAVQEIDVNGTVIA